MSSNTAYPNIGPVIKYGPDLESIWGEEIVSQRKAIIDRLKFKWLFE